MIKLQRFNWLKVVTCLEVANQIAEFPLKFNPEI